MTAPDTEYLTAWSLERQRAAERASDERCPACGHFWHGMECSVTRRNGCPCPTSIRGVS